MIIMYAYYKSTLKKMNNPWNHFQMQHKGTGRSILSLREAYRKAHGGQMQRGGAPVPYARWKPGYMRANPDATPAEARDQYRIYSTMQSTFDSQARSREDRLTLFDSKRGLVPPPATQQPAAPVTPTRPSKRKRDDDAIQPSRRRYTKEAPVDCPWIRVLVLIYKKLEEEEVVELKVRLIICC
jgi:hypothetical protein